MIKAVLFDLFETLITESHTAPVRASSLGGALGLEPEAFRREWNARRARIVLGTLGFGEALAEIATTLRRGVDRSTVERLCEDRMGEKATLFQQIEPEVLALVGALRRRDIQLGVVSNCFAEDVQSWSTCPLAPHFQCVLFSFAVGLAKPNPEIYREATRRLGVDPQAAIFIGDGTDNELVGAEHAGLRAFRALWFRRRWPNFRAPEDSGPQVATCEDALEVVAAG